MQRDPYAAANLLETISKDIMYLVHHMSTTNPESNYFSFQRFFVDFFYRRF